MLSELFNSTPQVTPASKFASLELSLTAPTGKLANDSQKSAQIGLGEFCFFPAGLDFFLHFATGWLQSRLHLCARN